MPEANLITEHFADKDNCYYGLGQARKCFTNSNTTQAEYEAMEKGLGLMYLYCPDELTSIVEATRQEATQRAMYFSWFGE